MICNHGKTHPPHRKKGRPTPGAVPSFAPPRAPRAGQAAKVENVFEEVSCGFLGLHQVDGAPNGPPVGWMGRWALRSPGGTRNALGCPPNSGKHPRFLVYPLRLPPCGKFVANLCEAIAAMQGVIKGLISSLLVTKGIATRSKKLLGAPGLTTRSKKLLGWRPSLVHSSLRTPTSGGAEVAGLFLGLGGTRPPGLTKENENGL